MNSRRRIIFSVCQVLFFLVAGTVGYVILEHYTVLEALYMTVITITTVGFGEIHALSDIGRVFTIFLLLFGVGSLAYAVSAFSESIIERASSPLRGKHVMEKKISRLKKHTIICGHGRVGEEAANHLADSGKKFVVLESSPEQLAIIKEKGYLHLSGDATREKTLLEAGIKKAGSLLALLNSDPDNLFTVLTARELNPTLHIVARSESADAESKILRAGADSIISPYATAGRRVAARVMAREMKEQVSAIKNGTSLSASQSGWLLVDEESGLAGHAVDAAATFLAGEIVGIRRNGKDMLAPTPDTTLDLGDRLFLVHQLKVEKEVQRDQPQKIVLIDDNPVIRRLYTRLFQKAGYNIITAAGGREGCELIRLEQPAAAVVDFQLEDISGLDVCECVRKSEGGHNVKLFLFTADEREKVRREAMGVGVDFVVLKSPEASEIVNLVKNELSEKKKM